MCASVDGYNFTISVEKINILKQNHFLEFQKALGCGQELFALIWRLFMDILFQLIGWTITIAISIFVIVSVVLFIRDGILAKREGKGRKMIYIVMFGISMTIITLVIIIVILLYVLGMLIMRSM